MNSPENMNTSSDTVLGKALTDAGIPGVDEALDHVKGYAQSVTDFIKARPVAVLLTACAVGAAVAFIATSRNGDQKAGT